jgi:hypothetical protein
VKWNNSEAAPKARKTSCDSLNLSHRFERFVRPVRGIWSNGSGKVYNLKFRSLHLGDKRGG